MTLDQLENIFQNNFEKFSNAINFISKNQHLKNKVDIIFNAKALINREPAKEKIRLIFIDALSAAGGSNLTRNGVACRNFNQKINQLPDSDQVNLKCFYTCFDQNINNITGLYDYLHSSDEIVNFGKKKSALFIYKLNWLQTNLNPEQKIFNKYNVNISDLIIPVDIVITLLINKLLSIPDNLLLDQYKDFDLINSFFKSKMGANFLLIEDFWFWGYFTTKGRDRERTFEFNDDKFDSSHFIKPTEQNRQYFYDFLDILND